MSSHVLLAQVLGSRGGGSRGGEEFLHEQLRLSLEGLHRAEDFLLLLSDMGGLEGATLSHYRLALDKLLGWIEKSHKSAIKKLGSGLLDSPYLFWTPFLECFFLEQFHVQFFRTRSKDLSPLEADVIEKTCRLIKVLCRTHPDHGENFHNVVLAGTYGACQFLSRVLRYYRDREKIVKEALLATNYLTLSKANPANKEELNTNSTLLEQVSDAPVTVTLFKVLQQWHGKSPAITELVCATIQSVAQGSLQVRKKFGRAACGELLRTLQLYCHSPASASPASSSASPLPEAKSLPPASPAAATPNPAAATPAATPAAATPAATPASKPGATPAAATPAATPAAATPASKPVATPATATPAATPAAATPASKPGATPATATPAATPVAATRGAAAAATPASATPASAAATPKSAPTALPPPPPPSPFHSRVCLEALRAIATLCDTDHPQDRDSSESRGSSSGSSSKDLARDALWGSSPGGADLCAAVIEAMWVWGEEDAQVCQFGFRAISKLVHRDEETGPRRQAFGSSTVVCRRGPYERQVGVCDLFLRSVLRWLECKEPAHFAHLAAVVDEGVKCLHHLSYKGQRSNAARFTNFFQGSADDLTEVLRDKAKARFALEHKLQCDLAHYEQKGNTAKARALEANMPKFLLPPRRVPPPAV